ncbi:hypothetical protein Vi05172_g11322 [Venturia inaequalis]|uniref:Uncharacterized protein n=1 Tax=Venturia inaequalis TaxID=5025 RepID=A0A8H3ZI10_VENIN|nr:hypothetical protein EG327_000889 [Venturia inaequalis]RDI78743.1 hypothetical protein Vi05172_g11322 [Venturia inaequalis]
MLFLSFTLFATFVIAIPHPLQIRAGGPIAKPIPSNCTITNPLLCTSAAYCPPISYKPFRPTTATLASGGPLVYAYYLQPEHITSSTADQLFQKCIETCYGYGTTGSCKSVYQAYNYPAPPMYGGAGGNPTTACLLFNRAVTVADFEVVPESESGKWTASRAGSVSCPAV